MTMQIGRYPSESSHEGQTIWQMYFRHLQVDQLLEEQHCGECRHFSLKRCRLFDREFPPGSVDWSPDWLACGAFWAHEGEVER